MSTFELFTPEYDILLAARRVANQQDMPAEVYRDTLLTLAEHYQRLVRESHRLISRSDRAEKELNRLNHQLHKLATELEYKATHDPLTNVYNRGAIIDRINQTLEQNQAGLIVLDIDNFKSINDNFGHPFGDEIISTVAKIIKKNIRGNDFVGRYGGEEFLIVLNSGLVNALPVAEKMRLKIQEHVSASQGPDNVRITVSVGVAEHAPGSPVNRTVANADSALYQAKTQGKNRVIAWETLQDADEGNVRGEP